MLLTPHLSLEEMAHTDLRQYQEVNLARASFPSILAPLQTLCGTILEPIRNYFGRAMYIHSGFRTPELNTAVGSTKPNSQHTKGEAADFHLEGVDLLDIFNWIRNDSGLAFGQVILEGSPPSWVHVSLGAPWRPAAKCGQAFVYSRQPNGEWAYVPFLRGEVIR